MRKWIFGIKGLHLFIAFMLICNVWWILGKGFVLWELVIANVLVGGVFGGVEYGISRGR